MRRGNVRVAGQDVEFCKAQQLFEIFEHIFRSTCADHMSGLEIELLDDLLGLGDADGILLSPFDEDYRLERIRFVERDTASAVKGRAVGNCFTVKELHDGLVVVHYVDFIAKRL